MGQESRPSADVTVGGWLPTPLWEKIKETPPPDTVAVSSRSDGQFDSFEVKLAGMAWPKYRDAGTHKLTVRLKKTGPDAGDVVVALLQGSARVAKRVFLAGTTYQDFVMNLSAAEVAQITNYNDLRLKVVGGRPLVPCCPNTLPLVLNATFSGALAALGTVSMDFDDPYWVGDYTACAVNGARSIGFTCVAGQWVLFSAGGTHFQVGGPQTSCAPFLWSGSGTAEGICAGPFTVTVMEP